MMLYAVTPIVQLSDRIVSAGIIKLSVLLFTPTTIDVPDPGNAAGRIPNTQDRLLENTSL